MSDGPAKVRDRRDPEESDLLDPETLQPGFRYRWVQERGTNVVRKRNLGYTFVNASDGVTTLFEQDDKAGDGLIRHGDRILMKEPIAKNEERSKKKRKTSDARLKSADSRVRDLAARNGVKLSEGDEEK